MEFLKKVTRSQLLTALFVLLAILLLWGGLKLFFGISPGPLVDQLLPNGVILGAVVIFGWNRWLLAEENKRKDAEKTSDSESSPS